LKLGLLKEQQHIKTKVNKKIKEIFNEFSQWEDDPKKLRAKFLAIDWSFKDENTSYLTHGIHPYPAKFIPQIASSLIQNLSSPGELVFDPFSGSGTTALEANLARRKSVNIDLNPLAIIIGQVKTTKINNQIKIEIEKLIQEIKNTDSGSLDYYSFTRKNKNKKLKIPEIPNIEKWFHNNAIKELSFISNLINNLKDQAAKNIGLVSLSKTILRVSNQVSETQYSSKPKEIPKELTINLFLENLQKIVKKLNHTKLSTLSSKFILADIRKPIVGFSNDLPIKENSIDLVVTSPPYPNVTDYHLYHRFRLFWLGYDPRELANNEIGSHLRHQKEKTNFKDYMSEMKLALENIFHALKPGRYAGIIVGDGIYNKQIFETGKELANVANELGFEKILDFKRPVHEIKRSFIKSARRTKLETILILRKPKKKFKIILDNPSYKLWKYEEELQKMEIKRLTNQKNILTKNHSIVVEINANDLEKIKNLTFTHSFSLDNKRKISTWQRSLEHCVVNNSLRKQSQYVTHGIHSYKGKFYPQLAKCLFNIAGLEKKSKILDPFCGSGTVILEGFLNGLKTYGCDFNPLAVEITTAKAGILNVKQDELKSTIENVLDKINEFSNSDNGIKKFPKSTQDEIIRWFPSPVIDKMAFLLKIINQVNNKKIKQFLIVVLSSVIRSVSQQEPRDLRIRRRKQPIDNAPILENYSKALEVQYNKILKFNEIRPLFQEKLIVPSVWLGDSRSLTSLKNHIDSKIDAVITSPPYATALPYIDTDRLSFLTLLNFNSKKRRLIEEELIGSREILPKGKLHLENLINKNDFDKIVSKKAISVIKQIHKLNSNSDVGFRRKNMASLLYRYFNDVSKVFTNMNQILKKNGDIFIVIGDNCTTAGGKKLVIPTTEILKEISKKIGWTLENQIPITVTTASFMHMKHAIMKNVILHFKKN